MIEGERTSIDAAIAKTMYRHFYSHGRSSHLRVTIVFRKAIEKRRNKRPKTEQEHE